LKEGGKAMVEKRNERLLILIPILLTIIYNLVIFSITRDFSLRFWINYGFSMTSFLLFSVMAGKFCFQNGIVIKDLFFGIPLIYISGIYLAVQIVVSNVMTLFPFLPLWPLTILHTILLALYLVFAISAIYGKKEILRTDAEISRKIGAIRSLVESIDSIKLRAANENIRLALQRLKEEIRYSDPMSHPSLSTLEDTLIAKVNELAIKAPGESEEKNLADIQEVSRLIAERNAKCKGLKS